MIATIGIAFLYFSLLGAILSQKSSPHLEEPSQDMKRPKIARLGILHDNLRLAEYKTRRNREHDMAGVNAGSTGHIPRTPYVYAAHQAFLHAPSKI